MTPEQITALAVALLGSGGLVTIAVQKLTTRWATAGTRRRDDLDRAYERLQQARARADEADKRRRRAQEHASQLRRMLLEAPCIDPADIPTWPGDTGPIQTKEQI